MVPHALFSRLKPRSSRRGLRGSAGRVPAVGEAPVLGAVLDAPPDELDRVTAGLVTVDLKSTESGLQWPEHP